MLDLKEGAALQASARRKTKTKTAMFQITRPKRAKPMLSVAT